MSLIPYLDMSSSAKLEISVALQLCEIIDTPRALTVSLLLRNNEIDQYLQLEINPYDYNDPGSYADDALVTGVLSKSKLLETTIDTRAVALQSFKDCESLNRQTNNRYIDGYRPPLHREVQSHVARILGDLDHEDLTFVSDNFGFGPGATTGVTGRGSVLSDKYDAEMHLTLDLLPFYRSILGDRWADYLHGRAKVVPGNKFTTVPKNAKTDRGICIEPTLNIYVQKGIGQLMRRRLRAVGIDLNNQEINQGLAKRAHRDGLATIDMSSASDLISWSTVFCLLPQRWFELLEVARSPVTMVDGESFMLEKFSSMGNGYTFELESTIFAGCVFACVPPSRWDDCSVYGDDLIVPQKYADRLVDCLETFGFKVNHKKSCLAGRFFESCGTDWFDNLNVRPFFLRQEEADEYSVPYTMRIANALRLYAHQRMGNLACDARFRDLWTSLTRATPRDWRRCKVPSALGDAGLITSFSEANPRRFYFEHGLVLWSCRTVQFRPKYRVKSSKGALLMRLRTPGMEFTYGREPVRGFLGNPRSKRVPIRYWDEGLDWV